MRQPLRPDFTGLPTDFSSTGRLTRSVMLTLAERLDRLDGLMDTGAHIAPLRAAAGLGLPGCPRCAVGVRS